MIPDHTEVSTYFLGTDFETKFIMLLCGKFSHNYFQILITIIDDIATVQAQALTRISYSFAILLRFSSFYAILILWFPRSFINAIVIEVVIKYVI